MESALVETHPKWGGMEAWMTLRWKPVKVKSSSQASLLLFSPRPGYLLYQGPSQ